MSSKRSTKNESSPKICLHYLSGCSHKRRIALERLAKHLGKKVRNLTREDIENSGLCWAYSSAKIKYETFTQATEKADKVKNGTVVFPCPACFHWHVGTLPKLAEGDEFFFVDPFTPHIEYQVHHLQPVKLAPPQKLAKLQGLKGKYV